MNTPDSPYFRLSAVLAAAAVLILLVVVSQRQNDRGRDRDVYKVVEQMPLFPGAACGDLEQYADRKPCADQAMLEYIYHHIRYPKEAHRKGTQGTAVVSFIVEPHGVMSNVKVVRDPGDGLGQAALKVARRMKAENTRWEPGLHKGKPVAVQFNLPVRFRLE